MDDCVLAFGNREFRTLKGYVLGIDLPKYRDLSAAIRQVPVVGAQVNARRYGLTLPPVKNTQEVTSASEEEENG